jgi:N-acyl-L-homoserine lactone synthetase
MIDCVTIATAHCFPGNLIAAQHRLRYQEVIAKEDWSHIYVADEMEFDRYDNVATEYFIARRRFSVPLSTSAAVQPQSP